MPSIWLSSTPLTVTVCGVLQLAVVKVSEPADTPPSVASETDRPTVTLAVGALRSTTENVAVPPPSVVVSPLSGVTTKPATLIVTVSVSLCAPPAPLLPWSLVAICRLAPPLTLAVGVRLMPESAALMFASVPVNVIAASAVPSPVENVSPDVPLSESVPCVPVSVTCIAAAPASTSPMLIRLPLAALNTSGTPSRAVCVPGTVFTGASFTAVTVIDALAAWLEYAVVPPPAPGLAYAGVALVEALPVVWSQATKPKLAVSPLAPSGM